MREDAWIPWPDHLVGRRLEAFREAFAFRPSVDERDWPSYRVPAPSAAWRIGGLLGAFHPYSDERVTPYNLALLEALRRCVPPGEAVWAFDPNHECHDFHPHRLRRPEDPRSWPLPALPYGEYHFFVTADFRLGLLGHPWEATLTAFGAGFLPAFRGLAPPALGEMIRHAPR